MGIKSLTNSQITKREKAIEKREMVRLGGESSNTLADDLFETLEDWNTYLKLENIDLSELPESLPEAQKEQTDLVTQTRKQIRRPQP